MWGGLIVKCVHLEMFPIFQPQSSSPTLGLVWLNLSWVPQMYFLPHVFRSEAPFFFFLSSSIHIFPTSFHLLEISCVAAISCELKSLFLLVGLYLFLKMHSYFNFTSGEWIVKHTGSVTILNEKPQFFKKSFSVWILG